MDWNRLERAFLISVLSMLVVGMIVALLVWAFSSGEGWTFLYGLIFSGLVAYVYWRLGD